MPNYPLLKQGDFLPAAGVLQKLLNRTGATLKADGAFGPLTHNAVLKFQLQRKMMADGKVGEQTWPRLCANETLPIVDCIDVFDPSLNDLEAKDITKVGGNPILIGGMSNGVEQAVTEIIRNANGVFLLRFHGHGAKGMAGISTGHGRTPKERSEISLSNLEEIRPIIRRLKPIFGPYGCVQFMHCETGGGKEGHRLLQEIADDLQVPVTAGVFTQFGGFAATFKFEGPTFTALPGKISLSQWCQGLPNFVELMVA
jgi:hypothetical protein